MSQRPIITDIIASPPPPRTPDPPRDTPRAPRPARRSSFRILFIFCTFFLFVLVVLGWVGYRELGRIHRTTTTQLRATLAAARTLDSDGASAALQPLARDAQTLAQYNEHPAVSGLASWLAAWSPTVASARDGTRAFTTMATSTLDFFQHMSALTSNAFSYAFHGKGSQLLTLLTSVRDDLRTMATAATSLEATATALRIAIPQSYFAFTTPLGTAHTLLSALLDVLASPQPQRLLLLFQNPSEIRPGGGFLGSYADITVHGGNVTNIDVRDIYDPDGQLPVKILAPRALQRISPRWGARDANWFPDFPTSAAKVIELFEQSKIYSERETTFIGAIALNVPIIEDLLRVTGPIAIPDYQLTIDADNFLPTVQREVESGEDHKAGSPKRILRVLTPLLLAKLADLNGSEKRDLVLRLERRMRTKDIMIYARDRAFEAYLQSVGIGGELYVPERPDYNDYLALSRANIGGGKTDILTDEDISLETTLDHDGAATNVLTVRRTHQGDAASGWWYKMTNRLFFQVLTPYGSTLESITGHDQSTTPTITRKNYLVDSDLRAIESTLRTPLPFAEQFTQFGKTTFASWLTTPLGETKTLTLAYRPPHTFTPHDGAQYKLIIERQSGSRETFHYTLRAPSGFIWKETKTPDFIFASDDLNGRTILIATLESE